ncbi:MAG: class I mannose-6-phosphate isomerase [Clostridiales bacterium]|nr:class I mannose-6-phosphate isomerase [Clostridiales bacterium]
MPVYKLRPACKDYIWGGTKLREEYGIDEPGDRVAEAWVLSCHQDGPSVIVSGRYAGESLIDYVNRFGKRVLGTNCEKYDDFPILTKLIDAKEDLSIQVHPNNTFAITNEGQLGKTEMWYVVDAEEGSHIYYGLSRSVEEDEIRRRIRDNTLTDILMAVPAKKGDVFYIPAGTLHAICKGMIIAEVQQNSNITYRVYDYGRIDKTTGEKRELHVEKALKVTRKYPNYTQYDFGNHLVSCKYFVVDMIKGDTLDYASERSFVSLVVLDGEGRIEFKNDDGANDYLTLSKGESFFIPANSGRFTVKGENLRILRTQI